MAFLAAIPAAAAAVAGTVGSAVASGAGALASGVGSALGSAGTAALAGGEAALGGLQAAGQTALGGLQTVGEGALSLAEGAGEAIVEGATTVGENVVQGAETLVNTVQQPFQSASNLATGSGDGALSTIADPMLSGGGGFGGYGNVVPEAMNVAQAPTTQAAQTLSQAPAQLAQVPSQGGGLAGMAEAQGFGTQNFGVGAEALQQPGGMADLMSSPMAQDMGMGRGVTMAQGGQVGQAGGQAVPVGAETAQAMATPTGFSPDYQALAKQGMKMMQQGQQGQQEQQGQGGMAAPPIPGAAPMGPLGMPDVQSLYGGGLSAEEMERLRALMGGF